jgi:cGMP-dependent protein kinase
MFFFLTPFFFLGEPLHNMSNNNNDVTDPNKANQDAYSISMNFGEQATDGFMGIYDGHGRDGDQCAIFAKNSLPQFVEKYVARSKTKEAKLHAAKNKKAYSNNEATIELTKDQIQTACLKAHVECNRAMHRAQELDDSLSGTTAISMYIHGRRNRITICNVGDSRAIIGQRIAPNESGENQSHRGQNIVSRPN